MRSGVAFVLLLGVSGLYAQPIPTVDKNGTAVAGSTIPVGSPSEYQASKIASSGAASASLSYGKVLVPSYVQTYDASAYSAPYPTANCHGHAHGYYGNPAHECKIFHICQEDGRLSTYDCPPYTKFNNYLLVCDWPHKVDYNCDPASKDEDYPVQSYNPAYPVDRSYVPSFMNLYPASPKPIYAPPPVYHTPVHHAHHHHHHEKAVYPILPLLKSYPIQPHYEHEHVAPNYAPVYDVYSEKRAPLYQSAYPREEKYEKVYPVVYPKEEKYPVYEKVENYDVKPVYDKAPAVYAEKPVVYEQKKHHHHHHHEEKPISYNYQAVPAYPAPAYPAPAYPAPAKPLYSAYPDPKPAYGDYVVEKEYPVVQAIIPVKNYAPAYPVVEKASYKAEYPSEKPAYKADYPAEKAAYAAYPQDAPEYQEKPAYQPEKASSAYPIEEKPVHHVHEKHSAYPKAQYSPVYPVYEKPAAYPEEKVYPTAIPQLSYSAYPVENPVAYKAPEYQVEHQPEHHHHHHHQHQHHDHHHEPTYPVVPEYPAVEYPAYVPEYPVAAYPENEYKSYEKVPATVASYAAVLKNYNDYITNRYEKTLYADAPYNQYRSRLASYLRGL